MSCMFGGRARPSSWENKTFQLKGYDVMAFATDGKTFCHQWQNVFSQVRKIDPLYRVRGTSLSSAPLCEIHLCSDLSPIYVPTHLRFTFPIIYVFLWFLALTPKKYRISFVLIEFIPTFAPHYARKRRCKLFYLLKFSAELPPRLEILTSWKLIRSGAHAQA